MDMLKKFLYVLSPAHTSVEQEKLTQELTEYQVRKKAFCKMMFAYKLHTLFVHKLYFMSMWQAIIYLLIYCEWQSKCVYMLTKM